MVKKLLPLIIVLVVVGLLYYRPYEKIVQKSEDKTIIDFSKIGKIDDKINLAPIPKLKKENKKVILISLDTVRSDLGVYGYKRNISQNIDVFAKEKNSLVFQNAYTPVPETLPAHIALFTGLYPDKTGYKTNIGRNEGLNFTSISKVFKENGYSTAGFYSSVVFSENNNIDLGFDQIDPPLEYKWSDRVEISAQETNKKAFEWLETNSKEDFFLWLHYYEAHNPYTAFCVSDLYSKNLKPANSDYIDGSIKLADQSLWKNIKKADYDYLRAIYDEEIYCLDKEFANLITKLKSLGIYDDSTIIVFGDHGESFEHQALFHGFKLYQPEVKVPLIVKSPLINVKTTNNISLLDIFPTLVEYFGLNIGQTINFDGISLSQLERNPNRLLYLETAGATINSNQIDKGLVFNNFKYIKNSRSDEFYNLETDKNEENNLFDKITKAQKNQLQELIKIKP
jgi:arylsulfatase A-like enzyme